MFNIETIEGIVIISNKLMILDGQLDAIGVLGGISVDDDHLNEHIAIFNTEFFSTDESTNICSALNRFIAIISYDALTTSSASSPSLTTKFEKIFDRILNDIADIVSSWSKGEAALDRIFNNAALGDEKAMIAIKNIYHIFIKIPDPGFKKPAISFTSKAIVYPTVSTASPVDSLGVDDDVLSGSAAAIVETGNTDSSQAQRILASAPSTTSPTTSAITTAPINLGTVLESKKRPIVIKSIRSLILPGVLEQTMQSSSLYSPLDSQATMLEVASDHKGDEKLRSQESKYDASSEITDVMQDILANIDATIVSSNGLDVKAFLTSSTYAYGPQAAIYLIQVFFLIYKLRLKDNKGKRLFNLQPTEAANILLSGISLGGASASVAGAVRGTASVAAVGNVVSGGAGGAANILAVFIESKHLHGVQKIKDRLKVSREHNDILINKIKTYESDTPMGFDETEAFFNKKLGNRKVEGITSIAISTVGIGGSALQILAVVAITGTMATGIGAIVVTAAAGTVGAAFGAHKLIKTLKKRSKLKEDVAAVLVLLNKLPGNTELDELPNFIKTKNDANRFIIALKIYIGITFSDVDIIEEGATDYQKYFASYFGKILYGENFHTEIRDQGLYQIMAKLKSF